MKITQQTQTTRKLTINVVVVGCFAQNFNISISFHAGLIRAFHNIDIASKRGWIYL